MLLARLALALVVAGTVGVTTAGCATTRAAPDADVPVKKKKRKHAPAPSVTAPPAAEEETGEPVEDEGEGLTVAEPAPLVLVEEGLASYYADSLAGNRTASGERYKPEAETCAHRTLPFGTILEVTAVESGRTSRCRVNDRGPFVKGRVIDVSKKVARDLGMIGPGLLVVRVHAVPE